MMHLPSCPSWESRRLPGRVGAGAGLLGMGAHDFEQRGGAAACDLWLAQPPCSRLEAVTW